MKRTIFGVFAAALALAACLGPAPAWAKVDLTTLPPRGQVQLTIYNAADLTLVREVRSLTLQKGMNRLEFGWANTAIDPTSLTLVSRQEPGAVELVDVSFPPRTRQTSIWTVRSEVAGEVEVEISYFTSGLSWQATYEGTLVTDQSAMDLLGYIRVTNHSGEDYPDAQVRVIVGKVHTVDAIVELARREHPYGSPIRELPEEQVRDMRDHLRRAVFEADAGAAGAPASAGAPMAPKQIVKEGLSEYFLYTIEGTETIADGWSKRLRHLSAENVPVVNLYKYEEERWGRQTRRFLLFANDEEHHLGDSPLPDGSVKVYRRLDSRGHLSFVGSAVTKYIPVDQKVELDLGPVDQVRVTPTLMDYATDNYQFDHRGNVAGFDEVQTWSVRLQNLQDIPARIQLSRNFGHPHWQMDEHREDGTYDKEDVDTVNFTVELAPYSEQTIGYTVRHFRGTRTERR